MANSEMPRDINNYLNQYIQLMDAKAAAVAAAALVVVGLGLSDQAKDADPLLRLIGVVSAGVSAATAGFVVFPRTPHSGNGHIFWADIKTFSTAESYWKSLQALTPEDAGREYTRQNYIVSGILIKKGTMVRHAIIWFAASCLSFSIAVGMG